MMDLHGLEIRSRDFAVRTLELSVITFLLSGPVGYSRFSSASVGQRSVDLGLNLLSCMLLRLGLASHLQWWCGGGDSGRSPSRNSSCVPQSSLMKTTTWENYLRVSVNKKK